LHILIAGLSFFIILFFINLNQNFPYGSESTTIHGHDKGKKPG
jgi:hypothetical protein